jgi:hypothetical protein
MRHIRLVGTAFALVCMVGAIATGGAVAHEFLATALGGTTGKVMGAQKMATVAGNIECTGFHVTQGTVKTVKAQLVNVTIQHTGCTAFGLAATFSPANLEFSAAGLVRLRSTMTIKATSCLVTVPSSKNQNLELVAYLNVSKEVELSAAVKGITSFGTGAACEYAEESKGTYSGKSLIALLGTGTLKWD